MHTILRREEKQRGERGAHILCVCISEPVKLVTFILPNNPEGYMIIQAM